VDTSSLESEVEITIRKFTYMLAMSLCLLTFFFLRLEPEPPTIFCCSRKTLNVDMNTVGGGAAPPQP
jgi:hypothetical protein